LFEAIDQTLDTSRQEGRSTATIDCQHNSSFSQDVVQVSLKPFRRLIDLLFPRLTTAVRIERQTDNESN
jgi:hypothetical protein